LGEGGLALLSVNIAPEVLAWALSRSQKSPQELETVLPDLMLWISGLKSPTLEQLEILAVETRTPIGFLFLKQPPPEEPPLWPQDRADEGRKPRLLNALTRYLLGLQRGFCFEGKRKRLLLDGRPHYADLLFYHRVLKCHVLVMLRMRKFQPEHLDQLNSYVRWYVNNQMTKGDNPPVGLLLCVKKGHVEVKYALAGISNQLFVSKYQLVLPTESELQTALSGLQ
jgi:hypothetical protein